MLYTVEQAGQYGGEKEITYTREILHQNTRTTTV